MGGLNISCVEPKVIDNIVDILNKIYVKDSPLTVTQGKLHDYLGMEVDFQQQVRCPYKGTNILIKSLKSKDSTVKNMEITPTI